MRVCIKTALLSCVTNVSNKHSLPVCNANYRHILNEWDTRHDVSGNDIDRARQVGLSNTAMANANVLPEMIDVRNGFKRCHQFYTMEISLK